MQVPTTTSGKIQRGACRQRFLDGGFTPVAEWHTPAEPKGTPGKLDLGILGNAFKAALQRRASRSESQS